MTALPIALCVAGLILLPLFAVAAFAASKRADDADEATVARMTRGDPNEFPSLQPRGE